MRRLGWVTGSLVGIALIAGSVGSAQARPRYDHGWGHHHYRDRDGFGFGDAVGIAALIGAVAIVASSMSRDRQSRQATPDHDGPPPAADTDYGADVARAPADRSEDYAGNGAGNGADDGTDDGADRALADADTGRMSDDCAVAARQDVEGQDGGYAEVRQMDDPRAVNDGYDIDGQVESRASYRATSGTTRRFTCSIRHGRVTQVYISRDMVMR